MRVNIYSLEGENTLVKEKGLNCPVAEAKSPREIADILHHAVRLDCKAEEYMYMLAFNTKMNLLGLFEISHGTVNETMLSPREIYIRALLCGATSIILAHNHPSGDVMPSGVDISSTKNIIDAGKLLHIPLLDHVIVSQGDVFSIRESGFVEFE